MSANTIKMIEDSEARWVDLRFTDTKGKEHHVTIPARVVDEDFFSEGQMFDGSSIAGWKGINDSDMIIMPDDSSAVLDPFTEQTTVNVRCDVIEPATMQGYDRDPRSVAARAEEYLKSTGIGDTAFFGPEPEFFVFDDVKWKADMQGAMYEINSEEAAWQSNATIEGGNTGHRPGIKGGYFPVPPVDSSHDMRGAMCDAMEAMGVEVEVHHHEVATANQNEIGTRFNTLIRKADEVQMPTPTARPLPLCLSQLLVTTVLACMCISLLRKMALTFLLVTAMVACQIWLCIISAASLSTLKLLTRLPTPLLTLTSV